MRLRMSSSWSAKHSPPKKNRGGPFHEAASKNNCRMNPSTSPSSFASNLQELIRLARVSLTNEEFDEFLARLAEQRELKEAA